MSTSTHHQRLAKRPPPNDAVNVTLRLSGRSVEAEGVRLVRGAFRDLVRFHELRDRRRRNRVVDRWMAHACITPRKPGDES